MLTEQRKIDRLSFITGSDAGIIVGLNKYKTRVDLYLEKMGLREQEDISDNPYVLAGHMLEGAIADWFTHATGWDTIEEPEMLIHRDYPWMAGNIDRRIINRPKEILEIKTSSQPKDWGEEWTSEIPETYLMQVAHYCAVADADVCYIAVLFHGVDFRIYKYERNRRLEHNLIEAERKFWEENIVPQVAPEPLTAKEVIALRSTVNMGGMAIADPETEDAYFKYMHLSRICDDLEAEIKTLKDKLCVYIGANEILLDASGKPLATWKASYPNRFDRAAFDKAYPGVYDQFKKQDKAKPERKFSPKQKLE